MMHYHAILPEMRTPNRRETTARRQAIGEHEITITSM